MSSCVYDHRCPMPGKPHNSVTRGEGTHRHLCPCTYTCTDKHMPTQTHRQVHTQAQARAQAQGHTEHLFTNGQEHVSVESFIRGVGYLVEVSVGVTNFNKVCAFIFNCSFLLGQWVGLHSLSMHSGFFFYLFGLPQATVCCFCVS